MCITSAYVHKLAAPDKSGQAVHSAVPIGIGSARISYADLQFTLSTAADSEYALPQAGGQMPIAWVIIRNVINAKSI